MDRPRSRIKDLRLQQGLTQRHLAETLGVSQNTIRSWEKGTSICHTIIDWILLSYLLDCRVDEMITTVPPLASVRQTPPPDKNQFRFDLRSKRERLKLTQLKISEALGISNNTYQNWETKNSNVDIFIRMLHVCELLKCQPHDLVEFPKERIEKVISIRQEHKNLIKGKADLIDYLEPDIGRIFNAIDKNVKSKTVN